MLKLIVKIILACTLISFLPACQPAPAQLPLTGALASRLGAAALTIREKPQDSGILLEPVSAATGKPVAGAAPVDIGSQIDYSFSPDRGQLAFVSEDLPGCSQMCLHILDVREWKEQIQPIVVGKGSTSWASDLIFDPQHHTIAVALNNQNSPDSTITLVDLVQNKVIQTLALKTNVQQMRLTPQGLFAWTGMSANKVGDDNLLHIALLDPTDLHTVWQQDLDSVRYRFETSADLANPAAGRYLYPAVVFTSDGSRIFAVPADKEKLVTVDLDARSVHSVTIQPRRSLMDRLMALGVGEVQAKMLNGTSKSGVISSDGKTLYLTGQTSTAVKDENGDWNTQTQPLGLQVIDTQDGALLSQLDNSADSIRLSLDDSTLFLIRWEDGQNGYSQPVTDLYDTHALKISGSLQGDLQPSRLLDGSIVWLVNHPLPDGSCPNDDPYTGHLDPAQLVDHFQV